MAKVSVVVAVYQVERYIVKCLESLAKQTFQEFEVPLIDDGCTDLSGAICDEYAKKDSRFKVFHKNNEGVSSARQFGLENANGEYIIHVDPDDWVEPTMLEELYAYAKRENADVVICDYFDEINNNTSYVKQEPNLSSKDGYFKGLLNSLYGACWNKLVRRSCFSEFEISFVKGMVLWEDKLLNLKLAEKPIKVKYLPKAFYHYVTRKNSAIRKYSKERVYSIIQYTNWLEKHAHLCSDDYLNNLKKMAKREAFGIKSINNFDFNNIYPEINDDFSFKIFDIGRTTDFYIVLALKSSLSLFRFIFFFKCFIGRKIRSLSFR